MTEKMLSGTLASANVQACRSTLCIRDTLKRVLLQTVKTLMKCSIGVYTVRKGTCKADLRTKEYNSF